MAAQETVHDCRLEVLRQAEQAAGTQDPVDLGDGRALTVEASVSANSPEYGFRHHEVQGSICERKPRGVRREIVNVILNPESDVQLPSGGRGRREVGAGDTRAEDSHEQREAAPTRTDLQGPRAGKGRKPVVPETQGV